MKLQALSLDLKRPDDISLLELRNWILSQLNEYGQPLRWFITAADPKGGANFIRKIRVEAVVIIV